MKSTKYSTHKINAIKLAGLVFSNFVALSYSSQSFAQLLDPSPLRDPASAQIDQTPTAPLAVHPMSGQDPKDPHSRADMFSYTHIYSYQMTGTSTTTIRYRHQGAPRPQLGTPETRTEIQPAVRQYLPAPSTVTDGSPVVTERKQESDGPKNETPQRIDSPRPEIPRTETPRTELPKVVDPAQDGVAPKPLDEVSALDITAKLKELVPNNALIKAVEDDTIIPQLRATAGEIETLRLRGKDRKLNGKFTAMVRFVERELDASGARRYCRIRIRGTYVKSLEGAKALSVNIEKADKPEFCYAEQGKDMHLVSSKDGSRLSEAYAIRLLTERRGRDKRNEVPPKVASPTEAPAREPVAREPVSPVAAADTPARPAAAETRLPTPRPLITGPGTR